eukprot:scaffold8558_cov121-Isochrysis_galbana.AAC.2
MGPGRIVPRPVFGPVAAGGVKRSRRPAAGGRWMHRKVEAITVGAAEMRPLGFEDGDGRGRAALVHLEERGVAPRGVDEHFGREDVGIALEAHLVIPASGGAVRQDLDLVLGHRLDQPVARDDAADAGGVPVAAVVPRLRLQHLEAPLGHLGLQVNDDGLDAAGGHALAHVLDVVLIRLAQVG